VRPLYMYTCPIADKLSGAVQKKFHAMWRGSLKFFLDIPRYVSNRIMEALAEDT